MQMNPIARFGSIGCKQRIKGSISSHDGNSNMDQKRTAKPYSGLKADPNTRKSSIPAVIKVQISMMPREIATRFRQLIPATCR